MAWAERLPSGKFRGVYRDRAGKKHTRSGFLHKPAARRWAEEAEDKALRGLNPDAGLVPLSEWATEWEAARMVEATTEDSDTGRLEVIRTDLGDVALERLSALRIRQWVKDLGADGRKPATVRKYFNLLSKMLGDAVLEGIIPVNPCRHVTLPSAGKGREVYLTEDEVEAIADGLDDPYKTVTLTLPYTGLRWGELAGLHLRRLDVLRRQLTVVEVLIEVKGQRSVKPYPKNSPSRRVVPVPSHIADAIALYLSRNPRRPEDLVFLGLRGSPLSRHHYSRVFRAAREAAGVDKPARPHDLRHSGASWLVQAGVKLPEVSKWLGHSSLTTTERYAHLAPGIDEGIRKVLDRPVAGDATDDVQGSD